MNRFCIICFMLVSGWARGDEVLVSMALETNGSSLALTLNFDKNGFSGESSNTQNLDGLIVFAVDDSLPLAAASLRDFDFNAVSNFQFSLFSGLITAGATNFEIFLTQSEPYVQLGADGDLSYGGVPNHLRGFAAYEANGPACGVISPCNDVINLADRVTGGIGQFAGNLSFSKGVLRFSGGFSFADAPVGVEGASISGTANVRTSGLLLPKLQIQIPPDSFPGDPFFLSWSAAYADFRVFSTRSLVPPVHWTAIDPSVISTNGNTVSVLIPSTDPSAFYSLRIQ